MYPCFYFFANVPWQSGARVDIVNQKNQTPLHIAATERREELIQLLLDKKADSNVTDMDGNLPLDLAAKVQHETGIKVLLEHSTSSKTEDDMKILFRKAMKSQRINDGWVKYVIRGMSPLRYEPANVSYSDCILLFIILSTPLIPLASTMCTVSSVCSSPRTVVVKAISLQNSWIAQGSRSACTVSAINQSVNLNRTSEPPVSGVVPYNTCDSSNCVVLLLLKP